MHRLAPLALILLPALAHAEVPQPPPAGSPPEAYIVYLVVLLLGGQLMTSLAGLRKSGNGDATVKAIHEAVTYTDEEGTVRPTISGVFRRQLEEAQAQQTVLLTELVEETKRNGELLGGLAETIQSRPCMTDGEEGR